MKPFRKKIKRKLRAVRGRCICKLQPNPLTNVSKHIVTIYHDFEGGYAIADKTVPCLEAVEEMLKIEAKHGVLGTYCTVARFAEDNPVLIKKIHDMGHEIASHSYDHQIMSRMSLNEQYADIQKTHKIFNGLGIAEVGHRSPQSEWNFRLMKGLIDNNSAWSAENGAEPYPYIIMSKHGRRLWRFPIREDDWSYEEYSSSPGTMLAFWQRVINHGREHNSYTAIGFHPWLEAAPERLQVFDEFLAWLMSLPNVLVLPFGDVKKLVEKT